MAAYFKNYVMPLLNKVAILVSDQWQLDPYWFSNRFSAATSVCIRVIALASRIQGSKAIRVLRSWAVLLFKKLCDLIFVPLEVYPVGTPNNSVS